MVTMVTHEPTQELTVGSHRYTTLLGISLLFYLTRAQNILKPNVLCLVVSANRDLVFGGFITCYWLVLGEWDILCVEWL